MGAAPRLLPGAPMFSKPSRPLHLLRRLAGTAWLAAWCVVLLVVAAPWRALGGLESERLRWLEGWALLGGLVIGFTMGRAVRDWAVAGVGRTLARALRFVLYPPAALCATALLVLSTREARGAVGVVASAFLAYWAGLDAAFGAAPLMEGKPYAFARPLPPDDADDPRESWDRL